MADDMEKELSLEHGLSCADVAKKLLLNTDGNKAALKPYGVCTHATSFLDGILIKQDDEWKIESMNSPLGLQLFAEAVTVSDTVSSLSQKVVYAGGRIQDKFIHALNKGRDSRAPEELIGRLVGLPFLAVANVRCYVAKHHGIDLNHGFNLKAAAIDWMNWVLRRDVKKRGLLATIVKNFLDKMRDDGGNERFNSPGGGGGGGGGTSSANPQTAARARRNSGARNPQGEESDD